jgi:ribonuclease P protein component
MMQSLRITFFKGNHETHIPTKQKKAAEHMRISQKNENSQRKTSRQSAPQGRTKDPNGLNFPKAARILFRSQYQRIQKEGIRLVGQAIVIQYRRGTAPLPRLGITISRRYGKAHDRNRFKRLVREAFRHVAPELPRGLELNVGPKGNAPIALQTTLLDLRRLINVS